MKAPFRWRAALGLLRRLPQAGLSRAVGRLAELPLPRVLRGPVNGSFARLAGVDLDETPRPPSDYHTLADFFVRELKAGVRSWPEDPQVPASPVDGILGPFGRLQDGTALQAKGIPYGVEELLGDPQDGRRFSAGLFATLYLSPRHYHRVHAPVNGRILGARAIPGRLFPVNGPATLHVPDLFPRNERLVLLLDAEGMDLAVVAVGAYNVGRIAVSFDPEWNGPGGRGVTNRRDRRTTQVRSYEPPLPVLQGEELMRFNLGSTVILLFGGAPERRPAFHPELRTGSEIRLGSPLLTRAYSGH